MNNSKRCVVTGLGLICAAGGSVPECWNNITGGISGIKDVKSINTDNCYATKGAEIPLGNSELSSENYDRSSLLCIKAAEEAVKDSGIDIKSNSDRIGVIIGNCVGGAASIDKYYTDEKNGKADTADIYKMTASCIANNVARHFGADGTTANIVNACAAGTISISYACDLIRSGKADAFIAGGSDAFTSLAFSGFHALHALDENPCSPFNNSHGITLGEGAGILLVESYESAVKRGARIYCEILGSGVSSDAYHITAPRPDGEGQMSAIKRAMENSGLTKDDIDYINAHGTGTAKNDEAEFLSLHTLFDGSDHLSVSSTKSMTGHCLGAAGSIEAVFAVKSVCENKVPPTIGYNDENLTTLKEKAGAIDFTPNVSRDKKLSFVMSNSFAFGGNNASIVFSEKEHEIPDKANNERIFITGIGSLISKGSTEIKSEDYSEHGIKMAFYRKLDRFSQLQLISGMRCIKDAAIPEDKRADMGIIIGTCDGPLTEIVDFQKNVIENGTASGSAFSFPNTVYNAAGGYFSIFAGIKGYNVTDANGRQAGLQSICYACDIIRKGDESLMIASGTDENTAVEEELYGKLGLLADTAPYEMKRGGFPLGEGSVSLAIESETHAKSRNAKIYAEIKGYGTAHDNAEFSEEGFSEKGIMAAVNSALAMAGLTAQDIDAISGFGNGNAATDKAELEIYSKYFSNTPVISVKAETGEARAASAAMQAAVAAKAVSKEIDEVTAYCGGKLTALSTKDIKRVLAVSYGAGGTYSAVIIEG